MKIVIRCQGKVIREYPIADGAELALGRQPDVNDIVLDDIKASRKHARITCAGSAVTFTDLGSGNGTWRGEERLAANTPVTLAAGSELAIGGHTVSVEEGEAVDPAAVTDPQSKQRVPAVVGEGKTGMLAAAGGNVDRQSFGLGEASIFIGRTPDCHIQITDALSSRKNTEILRVGRQYKVKDLGSTNGTFLNDEKAGEEDLAEGDVIRIGEVRFTFSTVDSASAPPVPQAKPMATPAAAAPSAMAATTAPEAGGGKSAVLAVVGIVVVAVAAIGIYFGFIKKDDKGGQTAPTPGTATPAPIQKTYPVRLGKPLRLDMAVTLKKTGDVRAWKESKVTFAVGTKVESVHVRNGQRVPLEAPLVTFELTDQLKTERTNQKLALNKAKQDIVKALKDVEKAERNVKNAEDNLKIAQASYDRNKPLYDKGNLLQTEWDNIKRRLNNEKTSLDVKRRDLEQAKRTVQQLQDTAKQVGEKVDEVESRVGDLTYKAKIAGVVSGLDLKKGYTITPANNAMSIIEYEKDVKVVVAVPEDDIALVKEGMSADVWLSKAPDRIARGTVTMIPAMAKQRNYDVELKVPNPETLFRPGAQAQVRFVVDVHKGALGVPSAVIGSGKRGEYFVYRYDAGSKKVERVAIKPGVESMHDGRKYTEVLRDPDAMVEVKDTDLIVFDGHKNLRDGAAVNVKNKTEVGLQ